MGDWTADEIEWLLICRDVLHLPFSHCAEQMNREYPARTHTKRSCIGAYHRAEQKGVRLNEQVRKEVKQCRSQ